MSVPGIVQSRLDGEQVAAQVSLGGEDTLYVTPTRTLIYRADGLLSDESVDEYPHGAERIEISEGRRKSSVSLDYGIDGTEKFKIPSNRLYEALHPVLAGVLNAADVTGPDETVKQTYQFSELTLVITSDRVVKHVGAAVWDQDYEEFPFADVTALEVEEGNVSSQIIIESDGRPQRIKTPSDQTREVRERIERALLAFHDVGSYEEFARAHAEAEAHADAEGSSDADQSTSENDPLAGGGVTPIEANPPELDENGAIIEDDADVTTDERAAEPARDDPLSADAGGADAGGADATANESAPTATTSDTVAEASADTGAQATPSDTEAATSGADTPAQTADTEDTNSTAGGFADSGFESASSSLHEGDTEERLDALTEMVERQNELLEEQQRTLETLIEELSRGRGR